MSEPSVNDDPVLPDILRAMTYRCPGCGVEFGYGYGDWHTPRADVFVTCPLCEGMWPESKMTSAYFRIVTERILMKPTHAGLRRGGLSG